MNARGDGRVENPNEEPSAGAPAKAVARRGRRPARAAIIAALSIATLVTGIAACRGSGAAPGGPRHYTLRGEVVTVPAVPGGEIVLRHEAIADFRDESGAVVGMAAMTMSFPVAEKVSLAGVPPGAKVEAVLAVDWAAPSYAIESLKLLPVETVLQLEPAGR